MPSPNSNSSLVRFGSFTLDPHRLLLLNAGEPVALGPKVVETLALLVERAGELVTKPELMERLWPNRFVEESNLTQNIYRLRRVLTAEGLNGAIETLACRGYRFMLPVVRVDAQPASRPAPVRSRRRLSAVVIAAGAAALLCALILLQAATPHTPAAPALARLSPESHRLYLLGRYHWNLRSDAKHVDESLRYFREVVRRDPANPLGYSGLADAYMSVYDLACNADMRACQRVVALANANAAKAVSLDPGSVEAHTSLAMALHVFSTDTARSDSEFARAIQMDDTYALAHHWYGNALLMRGRVREAIAEHRAALALEPTSPATYAWLAEDAFFARRYRDAIAYARASLAIFSNRHPTRVLLGRAYEELGDMPRAASVFAGFRQPERDALLAELYARNGLRKQAAALLRGLTGHTVREADCGIEVAFAWLALGNSARAYRLLQASSLNDPIAREFLALDPRLASVRSDPRFRRWTAPSIAEVAISPSG